jgi:hypothetical protein
MSEVHDDLNGFTNPRLVLSGEVLMIRDDNRGDGPISWPNADPEEFIEVAARSYERDAKRIKNRNRVEGVAAAVMSSMAAGLALQEFFQTKNPLYLLGVPAGILGSAFGFHMPYMSSTLEFQVAYRQDAEIIRQMPLQIHHE